MSEQKNEWRPNKKQEPFLALPNSIREAFYGGGAGSGKSEILLMYPVARKWHLNPRFKQVFMRRTFPELRNEIVPRSRELYRKFGAHFNKSDMVWTFPRPDQAGGTGLANDGALVYLGHCENEDDVHKYDSMEINLYTPDELTSFTEWIYLYIGFQRVRTSDPSLPAIIRAAGMPGNIGHGWVKRRFIDPDKNGGTIIKDRKSGLKRIFIFATQADNPHIDPTYKQSLLALPEAEKNAKLHGSFDAYEGQVFEEFRAKKYPSEPDNALHVIEEFDIPSFWPRIIVGDWGFRAMTYVCFGAISPKKRVYLYRELHWRGMKIEEWAPAVKYFIQKEHPRSITFCKSAGQDRGQEHTIQEQISSALGTQIGLSNNNPGSRIAGKALVHEYLRWKQKEIPQEEAPVYDEDKVLWILRNKGHAEYRAYMNQFEPPPSEDNLPKLQIFQSCPLVVEALKSCVYAKPKDGKPVEDVQEFDGDDPYDALRYLVDEADRYFEEATVEMKKVEAQEQLMSNLHRNQDWTMFYRNARALEQKTGFKFARRYKH